MPDLNFIVETAFPVPYAAAPLLAFKLRVENNDPTERIHSVILQSQIQIEAPRRTYSAEEKARLLDLFGEPDRWSQTLRGMLWTHASVNLPPFTGSTTVDLPVPCTFDFNIAATKYFHALQAGEVPLCFLFSGSIFYETSQSALQVSRVSWSKEARHRLPVDVWKQVIDHYYPNTASLTLHREIFDRLDEYRRKHGIAEWDHVMQRLLDGVEERSAADRRAWEKVLT